MGAKQKGRASLAALREAYRRVAGSKRALPLRPALLGVGRVTNVEEEEDFEGRTMGVTFEEFAAVASGDASAAGSGAPARAAFETTPGSNTDVVWFIPWKSGPVSLGRTRDNDIVIPEYSVSAEHCRFRWKGHATLLVEDSDASNQVWVDGARLPADAPRRLVGGEELVLGRFMFRFLYADDLGRLLSGKQAAPAADGRPALAAAPWDAADEPAGGFFSRLFGRRK